MARMMLLMLSKNKAGLFIMFLSLLLLTAPLSCKRGTSPESGGGAVQEGVLLHAPGDDHIMLSGAEVTGEGKSAQFRTDLSEQVQAATFLIKRGSPNLTDIMVAIDDVAYNLTYELELETGFDEYGNLQTGYYVQLTALDLDEDGKKEVLVSVGDMLSRLSTTVFKFTGKTGAPGINPFENLGTIEGREKMFIENNKIRVPVGISDRTTDYKIKQHNLVEAGG